MMKAMPLLLCVILAGCAHNQSSNNIREAKGQLKHYPLSVKSTQAWLGHNFIVGDTPAIPTEAVPEHILLNFTGKNVRVVGEWNPGRKWEPNDNEENPLTVNAPIIRGDGIMVMKIEEIK